MKDVVEAFSSHEELPIKLDSVLDFIKSSIKHEDERVELHFPQVDSDLISGFYQSYVESQGVYADSVIVHRVVVGAQFQGHMRRLVATKEMLHVLNGEHPTDTPAAVEGLITNLCTKESFKLLREGNDLAVDVSAMYHALRVLCPTAALKHYVPAYFEGRVTIDRLTALFQIPPSVFRTHF